MTTKQFSRVEIKDAVKGEVSAVFATFNTIDKDGDVTLPGAFKDSGTVPISAYGHSSWSGTPPVGIGTIRETATEAVLDGKFFMDQAAGRDTFIAVKELAEKNLGEWSYGYEPAEFSFGEQDGRKVRFLAKQNVFEVSPVLQGAGVGTRTRSAKAAADPEVVALKAIRPHPAAITDRPWEPDDVLAGVPADVSVSQLRSMFAWVDGDPEAKTSYRYLHHHGIDGPANLKAVMTAIVALNRDETLSEPERKAVWEHLAAHMRDADRDPLKLRTPDSGPLLIEELIEGTAVLRSMKESAMRVDALRAIKGKSLSQINVDALDWVLADLDETKTALAALRQSPTDNLAREYARFISLGVVHS